MSDLIKKGQSSEMDALIAFGELAWKAGLVPKGCNQWQALAIIQTGKEMGLHPFQSLRMMAFINGRLTMLVQLQLALARNRGGVIVQSIDETPESCTIALKRGEEVVTCVYGISDAVRAGLVREGGSYDKYRRQMLRARAIGDALRIIAPDVIMGLLSPEEASAIDPIALPLNCEKLFPLEEEEGVAPSGQPIVADSQIVEQASAGTGAPSSHPSRPPAIPREERIKNSATAKAERTKIPKIEPPRGIPQGSGQGGLL